jgi:hypothetical protein
MPGAIRRALQSDIRWAELYDANLGSIANPLTIVASTDLLIQSDLTFTVQRPGSRVILTTRGGGQAQLTSVGMAESKCHVDFSGDNALHWLGGQRIMVANEFANPFTGHGSTMLKTSGGLTLPVGNHTIRFYLWCEAGGNYYCRNARAEFLQVTITEWFLR